MGVDKPKLNPAKLTPEQRDKLENWTQNKQQLQTLSDIAVMAQEVINLLDTSAQDGKQTSKEMGALLMDMRDSLTALKKREAPKQPDYATPVVKAVSKLEKALSDSIKAIDVKPDVKVDAPKVNVDAPEVNVDLKGVEKLLKTDIPKAFKDSIKSIPKPDKFDPKPLLDAWKGISEQLDSIDTASRMKPQFPVSQLNTLVTKQDDIITAGRLVHEDFDYISRTLTNSTTETYTYKSGGSGGTTVATVTVIYTDSSLETISTVEKT